MTKELTFNDLPMVVAQLRDEVVGMKFCKIAKNIE